MNTVASRELVLSGVACLLTLVVAAADTTAAVADKTAPAGQTEKMDKTMEMKGKEAPQPGMPSPEEMAAWEKAMTPGAKHRWLDDMVGTWDTTVSMWMEPGAPPEQSTGVSEQRWVLGGRQIEQRYRGTAMGQPFEGIGYTGYDNVLGRFEGTWMDSMSTGHMISRSVSSGDKEVVFHGEAADPLTGKVQNFREVVKKVSPDHHIFEMYGKSKEGTEFKMMEIHYKRRPQ